MPLLESEPIVDLAVSLATITALLLHECVDLATRDLTSEWASLSEPMPALLKSIAPVIDRRLRPNRAAESDDLDLAFAVDTFRRWQSAYFRRVAEMSANRLCGGTPGRQATSN